MHAVLNNALIGSWPCPITTDQIARLQGARKPSSPLSPPPLDTHLRVLRGDEEIAVRAPSEPQIHHSTARHWQRRHVRLRSSMSRRQIVKHVLSPHIDTEIRFAAGGTHWVTCPSSEPISTQVR